MNIIKGNNLIATGRKYINEGYHLLTAAHDSKRAGRLITKGDRLRNRGYALITPNAIY